MWWASEITTFHNDVFASGLNYTCVRRRITRAPNGIHRNDDTLDILGEKLFRKRMSHRSEYLVKIGRFNLHLIMRNPIIIRVYDQQIFHFIAQVTWLYDIWNSNFLYPKVLCFSTVWASSFVLLPNHKRGCNRRRATLARFMFNSHAMIRVASPVFEAWPSTQPFEG